MNIMQKIASVFLALTLITGVAFSAAPQPAHAFTLFGIRFFEKKPTPTPTIKQSPTPTPTAVMTPTPTPAVLGTQTNLPTTGPETEVGAILALIIAAFVARKYWQVSHRI